MAKNFVSIKSHMKTTALLHEQIDALTKERDAANVRASEAESSRDYWREKHGSEREKVESLQREKHQGEGAMKAIGETRQDYQASAIYRAHKELTDVKATEQSAILLQRALGNAQGILAAAIGYDAKPISLYPGDAPPRRRASDRRYDEALAVGMVR